MEVLARYCSIPGYNKLCCDSCSKRIGNLTPLLVEAAEIEEHVRFGSASQTVATSPDANNTHSAPFRTNQGLKESSKSVSTVKTTAPPRKSPLQARISQKRIPPQNNPGGKNLPAMASYQSLLAEEQVETTKVQRMDSNRESRWPTAFSEVKR